jgi:hypothetical protein
MELLRRTSADPLDQKFLVEARSPGAEDRRTKGPRRIDCQGHWPIIPPSNPWSTEYERSSDEYDGCERRPFAACSSAVSVHDFDEALARLAPGAYKDGLRAAQKHVLDAYLADHTKTEDLAIELPTGEGKTLIGLLLADLALDNGKTVAYLAGTKQLAEQVQRQAAPLVDLPVHLFFGGHYPGSELLAYNDARAVGVMNYWVYFNSHPKVAPADVVIFDDAHMAEQPLSDLFTLRITRTNSGGLELYEQLCDLVLQHSDASYPTLKAMRDGSAPRFSPPELIAFHDWSAVSRSAIDMIVSSDYLANQTDARMVWTALEPNLTRCGVLVGPTQIEIRPYHPPTQHVPGYAAASQRIYLSATIGRPGDLQRRLGTKKVVAIDTPASLRTTSTGRRTFIINPTEAAALSHPVLDFALDQADRAKSDGAGRVAWLCASNWEADELERILTSVDRTVHRLRAGDDPAFERWKSAPGADLVTAGRYDGLDLPDDVCRLVVIPSVPAGFSEFERFAVAYLGDASYMRHRIGQRVTQALGRANRTANDSALYLGLDPGFATALADTAVQASLATDLIPVVGEALTAHGNGWGPSQTIVDDFWQTHRTGPSQLTPPPAPGRSRPGRGRGSSDSTVTDSADAEVTAVTRMWLGDHTGAAQAAQTAAQLLESAGETEHSAFWRYVEAHAHYERLGSPDTASAHRCVERAVAAAPNTAWFVRLRRTAEALAGRVTQPAGHDALFLAWDEWIRETGSRLDALIARNRTWLKGTHDQRADALGVLGRLCGASADRPTGQSATDVRWEIKSGTPDAVPRSDVNQVLGQLTEERQRHPKAIVNGALLVEPVTATPDAQRAARDDIAIVNVDGALVIYDRLAELLAQYRTLSGTGTAVERGAARSTVEPQLPDPDWLAALLAPTGGEVLLGPDVARRLRPSITA